MGQFLAIGLRIRAAVRKTEVERNLNGKSADDILGQIEKKYGLADIYERKEKDEYYVYSLKNNILDKEYVPFIEKFYALRYHGADCHDSSAVVGCLRR